MSNCWNVQIVPNGDSIDVKQCPASVQVFQGVEEITVCAQNPVSQFVPYSFTATQDNQTLFGPLPATPLNVITLAITGTMQNPDSNIDYTVSGLYITLAQGIASGNTVYGMIQVA